MAGTIEFRGYQPGDLGRVIWLHADYYHRCHGFDLSFEAQEARELAQFLTRLDPARDLFLNAWVDGTLAGSISVDGHSQPEDGARLRWFIVDERFHGQGLGRALLERALDFCRQAGHRRVHLWTVAGLDAAHHLYKKAGFDLTLEQRVEQWGGWQVEQRMDLELG